MYFSAHCWLWKATTEQGHRLPSTSMFLAVSKSSSAAWTHRPACVRLSGRGVIEHLPLADGRVDHGPDDVAVSLELVRRDEDDVLRYTDAS